MKVEDGRVRMYSKDPRGNIVEHKFLVNPNDEYGYAKLQKYLKKGFTFEDPRVETKPTGKAEIIELEPESVVGRAMANIQSEPIKVGDDPTDTQDEAELTGNGFPCSQCSFRAKSEFGLKSHMRVHKD